MDSLAFDGYASYSDSSAPRTPSPRDEIHYPTVYKHLDPPVRNIFTDSHDDHAVPVNPTWSHHNHYDYHPSRPSLLQELYEPELPDNHTQHHQPPYDSWTHSRPNDYHPIRRATYPIARHDQDHSMPLQYRSFWSQDASIVHAHYARQDSYYADSLPPLPSEQSQLPSEHIIPPMNTSPHAGYRNFDENANIKLEDPPAASMMVSSYRCMPSNCHTLGVSYLPTGHPVHHTDDAASKETQYLRRRCFNCHTTEPPSWRRSTLNPGKIVCNKCGLYERTHLRPRPLRFDELRAGNKTRKQSKGTTSPKPKTTVVKKEPREFNGLTRRDSVSSSSSVQSGSATSDWDDSASVYSSTSSASATSYNSPNVNPFPLSRDASQSPPRDGGIRLPNVSLNDVTSLKTPSAATPAQSPSPPVNAPYYSPPAGTTQAQTQELAWQGLSVGGELAKETSSGALTLQAPPTVVAS